MDIQERINRIVKHLPDGRIQFMGYIWPAEMMEPADFHKTWKPTIRQCVEYTLGVDLSFYEIFPPPRRLPADTANLLVTIFELNASGVPTTKRCVANLYEDFLYNDGSPSKKHADPVQGFTRQDSFQCLKEITELVFQVCDDLTKAFYLGRLPTGDDDTIPRQDFLEWLDEYMPYEGGSKSLRQRIDPMGDLIKFLLASDQAKMKTNDVILLLENKKIRFDFPSMTEEEQRERVHDLYNKGLEDRMIALILDWPRVKNKQVQLASAKRNVSRLIKK